MAAEKKDQHFILSEELSKLIKNKNYLFLCAAYTFTHSNNVALSAMVSSLTSFYGYSGSNNSIFGGLYIVCGVLGSFTASFILDRFQIFKKVTLSVLTGALIFTCLVFLTLPSGNIYLFALNMSLLGSMVIPLAPISYSFAVELTYPTSEQISNGIIILPAKLYGTTLGVIGGLLAEKNPKYTIILFIINTIISLIASFFV